LPLISSEMINNDLKCNYQCTDIIRKMIFPVVALDTKLITLAMISEAPPSDPSGYFYRDTDTAFFQTTITAFKDAGISITNYDDLTEMGIYLTTAIKCSKKGYLVSSDTIKRCAQILEVELAQFPGLKVIMCMGDFAIKAINFIYKRKYGMAPIRSGSTYKIRKEVHMMNGIRFFPSYTQTGDSFNLEKSKRRMIAGDIGNALYYIRHN
jgi:uracil-DNA glycosylase